MNKTLLIIIATLALAAAGALLYVSKPGAPVAAKSQGVVKYQCSMHPQIVRDEPGDCPICHMKLEKVIMDAGHDHSGAAPQAADGRAAFSLSEYRRQLIGVRSEAALKRDVYKTLRLPGRIGEDRSRVLAQALEMDGASLKAGLQAEIRVAGEEPRKALVTGVDESLDAYSRTFGVYLSLKESPAPGMRTGVYCDARIRLKLASGLSVPKEAVLDTGDRQLVYVISGDRFEPREVVLGAEGDDYVELRKGLNEGEKVVTSANFLIDSESRFKSAAAQY